MVCSIFIASITASTWPLLTLSPAWTANDTTLPGMGAVRRPPSAGPRRHGPARRAGICVAPAALNTWPLRRCVHLHGDALAGILQRRCRRRAPKSQRADSPLHLQLQRAVVQVGQHRRVPARRETPGRSSAASGRASASRRAGPGVDPPSLRGGLFLQQRVRHHAGRGQRQAHLLLLEQHGRLAHDQRRCPDRPGQRSGCPPRGAGTARWSAGPTMWVAPARRPAAPAPVRGCRRARSAWRSSSRSTG